MKFYVFTNLILTAFPVLAHETTRKRNGSLHRFSTGVSVRNAQSAANVVNTNQVERHLVESMSMDQSMSMDLNPCGCQVGDGTFCGTDGKCHFYNCESFYEFGPVDYTGYGPQSPELKCIDIPVTLVDTAGDPSQASVAFRCRDLTPKPIGMGYTKYCEASTPNSNFTCYGVSENTNYYNAFDDFLQQAQASQLECNSGQYNETGYPAYSYSAVMSKREGITGYIINQEGFSDTQAFNQTKAVIGTMSSQFEAWTSAPTRSPVTYSPTYVVPNDDNISASNIATGGLAVMIALLAALF